MVNLDELRKKYEEINSTGGGTKNNFLKMTEPGTYYLRILPSKDEDLNFFSETSIHYINSKYYHCPREKGDKCPLCDTYYGLWKQVNELGKDNPSAKIYIDTARSIKASKKFYMNAVDRRDESVKIFSMGVKLYNKICETMVGVDTDYGDVTDLQNGWDFKVIMEKVAGYNNYDKSAPRPTSTPAGTDAQIATFMDELHDLQATVKPADYDELKTLAMEIDAISRPERPAPDRSASQVESEGGDFLKDLKNLNVD
tara:strand:- start:384 stop:1148 length:765 start_codon:yes stop_codon:yes gene_type:complete